MNKRSTVRVVAGTAVAALLGLAALAAPAQARDSAWNPTSPKDTQHSRILGAPSNDRILGGAGQGRILG